MTAYQYTALNSEGKRVKGVLEADSPRLAREKLREKLLTPLTVESVSGKRKTKEEKQSRFLFGKKKLSAQELSLITRQMATLLQAGIPVDEMLTGVAEQTDKQHIRRILLGVRAKVLEGFGLAKSMEEFPSAFPALYRTTIEAGERTGKLDQILNQLAEYTEKQHHIAQKLKQAMVYPIMMSVISISIIVFLLIYVVPKIVNTFSQTNQTLPMTTMVLIKISSVVHHQGVYILLGIILFIVLWRQLLKRKTFRRWVHFWLLKIPVIGRAIRTINAARFGRTFGILNSAGVSVLEAMHSAAALIKPILMQEKVANGIAEVREGVPINRALQRTGFFPPLFVHLVASGEASGQLDSMLEKGASYLEKDVEGLIDTALTLFEPLMIVVMGGIVLYIVLAIMLPIFALDQVQ